MNKVKANCYNRAKGNVKGIEGVELPSEINANEAHMFHVASIKKVNLVNEERYETNVRIMKFHKDEFIRKSSKKGGGQLGFTDALQKIGEKNIFILHDPTQLTEKVENVEEGLNEVVENKPKKEVEETQTPETTESNGSDFDALSDEDKKSIHWQKVVKAIEASETIQEAEKWVSLKSESATVIKAYEKRAKELENK